MSEMIISTDPVTGQILWQGSVGDVDQAVSRARSVLSGWAKTALEDRIVILERFAAIIREKADIFGSIIARETGKPFGRRKPKPRSLPIRSIYLSSPIKTAVIQSLCQISRPILKAELVISRMVFWRY